MEGSGHIDATVLRDADDPEVFASAADGVLESRKYYLQRWCADVVAVIDSKADPIEYVRYSAYGMPYVYAAGDMNRDGVCDSADEDAWNDLWNSGTGTARVNLDVNRDGAVSDSDDLPLVQTQIAAGSWASSGRGVLSRVGVRKGYAGYEWDPVVSADHVRHRVYLPEMGKWGRRDPKEYVEYANIYQYCWANPLAYRDSLGLRSSKCQSGRCPRPREVRVPPGQKPSGDDKPADACAQYCAGSGQPPEGGTLCVDGHPVICICDSGLFTDELRYGIPPTLEVTDQLAQCAALHEQVHVEDIDCGKCQSADGICQPRPPGAPGSLPWNEGACGAICSEAAAWNLTVDCLGSIDCGGSTTCQAGIKKMRDAFRQIRDGFQSDCNTCRSRRR